MNKRNLILLGFIVAAAAQIAVPGWMILEHERTLREGRIYNFKTRPVDPVDAFRGRYVWLSLEPGVVKVPDVDQWRYNQKAFAVLGTDSNGFATVERLEHSAPDSCRAVPVHVSYPDIKNGEVHINWMDLDRFYLTEEKAPAAERAYREQSRRTNQTCRVTVRVRGTQAVIENLFVENQPIRDWLKTRAAGK